ncbi:zinc-ribbon domain-containing protein [Sphingomonas astaxanthinifaciens]|uniref:Zinc finger/thioredoxin putative domain-containing protein n=1 Tax=Sphingomonas astaxanthinifaciens DSM 22298 TaxID=1123267 RepID=A0ABQ5Z457_9SPHN|nr:zinc-ribbon domain-containing protein [Sphingomonas astaxanthinifaciens]GLR46802.1 hypothetical protein GCM10007925_05130 [Sphingomonas astaxanthinifaciens DSM 22298]
MILTCPSCGTRYVVKDGAIPPAGRTVRCAQCKHSWHQDPDEAAGEAVGDAIIAEPAQTIPEQGHDDLQPREAAVDEMADAPVEQSVAEEAVVHDDVAEPQDPVAPLADHSQPVLEEPVPDAAEAVPADAAAAVEPYPEEVVPAEVPDATTERSSHPLRAARNESEDLYSPFADRDDDAHEGKRRWPMVAAGLLVLIALVAAAVWFLAPTEFKNRLGLAQASGDTPLLVQVKQHSRQELASGNQLLEVSGMVINPTDETQVVPPLNAQLRSVGQQVVYKWTIPPPATKLAPGGSASFNSANLNIPPAAACLEVFFGQQQRPPLCRDSAAVGA